MAKARTWIARTLVSLLVVIVLLVGVVVGALVYLRIPQNASGMAAKSVCSAVFVAGRVESAETLMAQDVLPASGALSVISTTIDLPQRSVSSRFLGLFERHASLLDKRGCVLDADPDPTSVAYLPEPPNPQAWPAGNAALPPSEWGAGVDSTQLQAVADAAFVGAGDPEASNTRGLAVVQGGRLLIAREAEGLQPGTALHGWSMTKTVAAMLFYKRAAEVGLDIQTPVVDAFPPGREPAWVSQWRKDERSSITIADLLFMRDGLQNDEGYGVTGSVVQMLYGEPDMADWAAAHPAARPAGTYWQYLSATANILAQVTKGQFSSDADYWDYATNNLYDPLGITSATLETDTSGTWVGSSYLWASVTDWARLGQLMLADGKWGDAQVLPAGWLALASTSAMPSGEGHGYGAQTWLLGDPVAGECRDYPGVPADTVAMEGHWGQLVATVPSRDAVVVRLGWTFNSDQFDGCQLLSDVLAALPPRG